MVIGLMQPGDGPSRLLEAIRQRPAWTADGACRGTELDFIPASSTKWAEPPHALAAVCARCPVRDACLAMALADSSLTGVWGGTADRQRAEMRRSLAA